MLAPRSEAIPKAGIGYNRGGSTRDTPPGARGGSANRTEASEGQRRGQNPIKGSPESPADAAVSTEPEGVGRPRGSPSLPLFCRGLTCRS